MTDETPRDRAAAASRQDRAAAAKGEKGASPRAGAGPNRPDRPLVRTRPDRYLLAAVPPADVRAIISQLEHDQSCRVLRTLTGSGSPGGFPGAAVVEMTPEHAAMLEAYPGIHVEPDYTAGRTHEVLPPVVTQRVAFEVLDDGLRPIEGATVTMADSGFPVTGYTGPDGRAEITVAPETLTAPTAIEIHPPRGCWPVRVRRPLLDKDGPVRVICTRITTTCPGFPERALDSWGARVMGFGRLPGLAPEAEIHICRVSPGGSAADVIEALDYCIEHQVDVAMVGACIPEESLLLAAKIEEAQRNGIACIAAGHSVGGLCWPAALPQVLGVGAIGQLGTFPPEDTDTVTLTSQLTPEGFFVPVFSSGGPDSPAVDCCAPGVAVISGLPPSSYGPLSSTGTAAAHVTALAALILAHHPLFRREPGRPAMTRDSSRPARLLAVIKGSCRPLPLLDPARTGAGIPDAAVALSVAPWATHQPLSMPYPAPAPTPDGRTPLGPLTAAMRAAGLIADDKLGPRRRLG